jgi:hypothetical protein
MANYIFVDFDGPLLPGKMHLFDSNRKAVEGFMRGEDVIPYFDPVAVKMHNLWAKHGNAKVVFSTSWARHVRKWEETEAYLKKVMRDNGYQGEFADDCVTPKRRSSTHIHEIQEWCYDNLKPEDLFIAVDDADLSFLADDQCSWKAQGKWIQCDYNDGLTWKNFKDGCEWLQVDNASMLHIEYGIVPKSEEEIKRERDLFAKFGHVFI